MLKLNVSDEQLEESLKKQDPDKAFDVQIDVVKTTIQKAFQKANSDKYEILNPIDASIVEINNNKHYLGIFLLIIKKIPKPLKYHVIHRYLVNNDKNEFVLERTDVNDKKVKELYKEIDGFDNLLFCEVHNTQKELSTV